MSIRKRLALALCRAAGLHQVADTRTELAEIRADHRRLQKAYAAHLQLAKQMAQQLNVNTSMMKRWHDGSPALQTIERAHARTKGTSKLILPPTADLRTSLRD